MCPVVVSQPLQQACRSASCHCSSSPAHPRTMPANTNRRRRMKSLLVASAAAACMQAGAGRAHTHHSEWVTSMAAPHVLPGRDQDIGCAAAAPALPVTHLGCAGALHPPQAAAPLSGWRQHPGQLLPASGHGGTVPPATPGVTRSGGLRNMRSWMQRHSSSGMLRSHVVLLMSEGPIPGGHRTQGAGPPDVTHYGTPAGLHRSHLQSQSRFNK